VHGKYVVTKSSFYLPRIRSFFDSPQPSKILLIVGNGKTVWPDSQRIADALGMEGALRLILGSNRYSLNYLPVQVASRQIDIYKVLNQIQVSRAETCYQMLDVLETTQASQTPLMIVELLSTFYDVNLSDKEVDGILSRCLVEIHRLGRGPLLITADNDARRPGLMEKLLNSADFLLEMVPDANEHPISPQLSLFDTPVG
jgi:hypothetical protein